MKSRSSHNNKHMNPTIAELMKPEIQAKMARYENHRIAASKGYEIASALSDRGISAERLVSYAREISKHYRDDLNEAITLIEEPKSGIIPARVGPIAHS